MEAFMEKEKRKKEKSKSLLSQFIDDDDLDTSHLSNTRRRKHDTSFKNRVFVNKDAPEHSSLR